MDPRIRGIFTLIMGLRKPWNNIRFREFNYSIISKCVNSSKVYVQLLQLNDFKSVKVIQCKVEIDRLIRKCGMFSHTLDVYNGKYSYIDEVTHEACQRMHSYGTFELSGTYIIGLKSNQTTTRPVILAGHVDTDGTCYGGAYFDPYGT